MTGSDFSGRPRRSAGMRGDPRHPAPEHAPVSTTPVARPEISQPQPASASRHPRPQILMGEVVGPRLRDQDRQGAKQREKLRAFMMQARLTPSSWARDAGIPTGELLGFLAGRTSAIPPSSLAKLAAAAQVEVAALLA